MDDVEKNFRDSISIDEFLSSISETRYNTTIVVIFSPLQVQRSFSKLPMENREGRGEGAITRAIEERGYPAFTHDTLSSDLSRSERAATIRFFLPSIFHSLIVHPGRFPRGPAKVHLVAIKFRKH